MLHLGPRLIAGLRRFYPLSCIGLCCHKISHVPARIVDRKQRQIVPELLPVLAPVAQQE